MRTLVNRLNLFPISFPMCLFSYNFLYPISIPLNLMVDFFESGLGIEKYYSFKNYSSSFKKHLTDVAVYYPTIFILFPIFNDLAVN